MKKSITILLLIGLIFITTACSSKDPYKDMSFKEACKATNGMWMKMQPTKDFVPTGQPACEGCMQRDGDHFCDKEKYLESLK